MDIRNYDAIITTLSNPDTFAEGLVQLNEQLKTDATNYTNLVNSNNNLRDTNARLALRVTNTVVPEKTEETPDQTFDRLFTSRFKQKEV